MKTITYDETKWKLVPVQPTEKMHRGGRAAMTAKGTVPVDGYEGATYAAMLSSAPTPPAVEQPSAQDREDAQRWRTASKLAVRTADALGPVYRIDIRAVSFSLLQSIDAARSAKEQP